MALAVLVHESRHGQFIVCFRIGKLQIEAVRQSLLSGVVESPLGQFVEIGPGQAGLHVRTNPFHFNSTRAE